MIKIKHPSYYIVLTDVIHLVIYSTLSKTANKIKLSFEKEAKKPKEMPYLPFTVFYNFLIETKGFYLSCKYLAMLIFFMI